jgi:hypothetical protein
LGQASVEATHTDRHGGGGGGGHAAPPCFDDWRGGPCVGGGGGAPASLEGGAPSGGGGPSHTHVGCSSAAQVATLAPPPAPPLPDVLVLVVVVVALPAVPLLEGSLQPWPSAPIRKAAADTVARAWIDRTMIVRMSMLRRAARERLCDLRSGAFERR